MTDTERLNLIEHYKWYIWFDEETKYTAQGDFGHVCGKTIREVIDGALDAQAKWMLS